MFVELASGFLTSLFSIQETATRINNWISCFLLFFFFFLFPPAVVKAFSFHVLLKILWCCQAVLKHYLKKETEPKPFTKPSWLYYSLFSRYHLFFHLQMSHTLNLKMCCLCEDVTSFFIGTVLASLSGKELQLLCLI